LAQAAHPLPTTAARVALRGRDADARVRILVARRAALRPRLAVLAVSWLRRGAHGPLGFRTLGDYARERLGVGARAVFLGADLPAAELADAALRLGARGVGVSVAGLAPEAADAELRALRRALPDDVPILLGGGGCGAVAPAPGVEVIQELEELEDHVSRIPC